MPIASRIVEIGGPARLSYRDCQLRIEREGLPPAMVPVEDIGILVLDYTQTAATVPLLAAVAAAGGAVVVCGATHLPESLLLPMAGSALHARSLRGQIATSEPCRKRLWQAIIKAKIAEQARLLIEETGRDRGLGTMAKRVKSGDTDNLEGQAARTYFPALFGKVFIRDPDIPGINAMLNYAYALLRAAVARAVVGAGLHPALGIHHHNQYDAFALADDLMEPLRPMADAHVVRTLDGRDAPLALDPSLKRMLLQVLACEVTWDEKRYPLVTALGFYAANVRGCLVGEERRLTCPVR